MIQELFDFITQRWDFLLPLIYEHLQISAIAIVFATIVGVSIGILIAEKRKASSLTLGIISFLYTIPSISMLGFLIPFSGVGNATAVIALTVYALLPMVRNTHTGIMNVNPDILEAARGMGSTQMQALMRIKLPLAMPVIMSGIRSMVTMTVALAGIASFIGAGGLGVAIYRGITTNNAAMTMAGSLLIALLALAADLLLGIPERRMTKHRSGKRRTGKRNAKKTFAAVIAIICIFVLVFGAFRSREQETIHIATKPMTEQYVLGEMMDILIEQDTDLNVELTQGVGGGTSNIQPAMESGEFDIYPEYTGTAWNMVLKEEGIYSESMFGRMKEQYKEDYDMEWLGMYGFNNTYGIAVRKEIADKYGLETYSDLQGVSDQLIFGAEYDFFEREDGYDALCETYGLNFKETMDLDIGLKYKAMEQGEIDVMVIFTTDGQLSVSDVKVLEDDKGFYPSYLCGNISRGEVLRKYPQIRASIEKLAGKITDEDMAAMNYQVESLGKEPREVAKEFLKELGLIG